MRFILLTLFPEMFAGPFDHSIIKRAKEKEKVEICFVNIRDFATDTHKSVDDHPYGGGVGMVMKVDVINNAMNVVKKKYHLDTSTSLTILLDPRGTQYTQSIAKDLTNYTDIVLLCGHYEGVDERIRSLVDMTLSIGDYVVTGGELPAMMIIDSVTRLLPGVLSQEEATIQESFSEHLLEYPQYTRPLEFNGQSVPEILLSGNHAKIEQWRKNQAKEITQKLRPDLLEEK